MLSPSLSVTAPNGATLQPTSSRRRALSYLRNLSQSRSGGETPPDTPRASPRSYFQRSTSYTEPRNRSAPSHQRRRRSASRPNESTSPSDEHVNSATPTTSNQPRPQLPPSRERSAERRLAPSAALEPHTTDTMARTRQTGAHRNVSSATLDPDGNRSTRQSTNRSTSQANGDAPDTDSKTQPPTIRFFPHHEVRSNGRQSLNFPPVSRTLPSEHSIIRVGRYSEREGIPTANPTAPSDAPVGFKSKVVSRKHCEFSFIDGQWHIRDVASSSGTFLNHIRLSQPNTESRQFPIKDGDIVQLGIDFRGGEEMIFRCVKIRIECNRSWQKKPNAFKLVQLFSSNTRSNISPSKSRHAQLQMLAKDQQAAAGNNSGECSICLGSVLVRRPFVCRISRLTFASLVSHSSLRRVHTPGTISASALCLKGRIAPTPNFSAPIAEHTPT
jgi:E3 ubiquitin-protein ligase DMA1/2